jgi:hypothetical protein
MKSDALKTSLLIAANLLASGCDSPKAKIPAFPDFSLATCYSEMRLNQTMQLRELSVFDEMKGRLTERTPQREIYTFDTTCHVPETNRDRFAKQITAQLTRDGWAVTTETLSQRLQTSILSANKGNDYIDIAFISLSPSSQEYLIDFQSTLDLNEWDASYNMIPTK